jgi:hypothetical protein
LINPKNSLAGSVGAPGWNLIVLFLLTLGLAAVSRAHRYGVLLLLPLMAASLLLTDKMADYSYLSFFPFAFGVMLAAPASPRQSPSNQHTQQKRYRLRKRIALAIGLVYGSLLLLYFYLSMANPFAQLSLQQSQATFRQTVAGKDLFSREHVVGFPALGWPSLVALGESGANLIALTPYAQPNTETFLAEYEARTHQSMRYFILQPLSERTKSGLAPFPPKDLYLGKVRFNLYQQNPANDPGFEQGQTPTSFVFTNPYTYSIYRRVDSPLPQS